MTEFAIPLQRSAFWSSNAVSTRKLRRHGRDFAIFDRAMSQRAGQDVNCKLRRNRMTRTSA
eukprot:CAMPEP_0185037184 /NCGR_PEP_ID=MMETSP1103-20130426/31233_1 /TAXON_ID=36769 /ORGANISM="Paraphysomonas bandaiensis, Strain Caron Lab Isolate" /LENGTH=60 /DNA_ID=CAMNT_0027575047 /DNA_START=611 /DNA_END=793 /DNA_ORIENTATION=-